MERIKEKQIPLGIKVISFLYYGSIIISLITLFLSFLIYRAKGFESWKYAAIAGALSFYFTPLTSIPSAFGTILVSLVDFGSVIVTIITSILFIILNFFIGSGLWKGQKWSRIIVLISSGFVVIWLSFITIFDFYGSHLGTFLNIITLANSLGIGIYLLFNKNVKYFFSI